MTSTFSIRQFNDICMIYACNTFYLYAGIPDFFLRFFFVAENGYSYRNMDRKKGEK